MQRSVQISYQNSLPSKISADFISLLSQNRSIRGAGRLYVAIRHLIGSVYHPDNADHQAILSKIFTKNQVQRYSKILVKHRLARRNKAGSIYLTKVSTICPPPIKKNGREMKIRYIEVPLPVLDNNTVWTAFLAGVDWAHLGYGMKFSKGTKERAKKHTVSSEKGGTCLYQGKVLTASQMAELASSSVVQCVSNSVYAAYAGVHKSTASRRRKKGVASGLYTTARLFSFSGFRIDDLGLNLKYVKLAADAAGRLLDHVVSIRGRIFFEKPSALLMTDCFTRK